MKSGQGRQTRVIASGFTIGRDARNGSFSHIMFPGRGEVGVISAESFKTAKEAAGSKLRSVENSSRVAAAEK